MGKRGRKPKTTLIEDIPDLQEDPVIESEGLQVLTNILDIKSKDPIEYKKFRYVLFATAIFTILSLPFTDRLIELSVPNAGSWLILLGIKVVLYFILFYILFYSSED